MKLLNILADAASTLLRTFVGLSAFFLIVCGVYVLNDIYYTNRSAFVSYDLLKYRPAPRIDSSDEIQTFTELREINPDTVGWIEMFGTNINYPIVQGNNNLEYLNKDIFGYSTLSGSIYLSSGNDSSFNDWYNIVYGHHMDNGAMFGDISKYLDPDFFSAHSEGILQTVNGDYSIRAVACVKTNAYEDIIYQTSDSAEDKYPELYDYIMEHSQYQTDLPELLEGEQLIGFSTCSDAVTDGRIVLFATVRPLDKEEDKEITERMTYVRKKDEKKFSPAKLTAKGHDISGGKWSLLNLMCLICTFLTLLPIWALKRKFGQFSYSKKIIAESEKNNSDCDMQMISDLRYFIRKGRTGLIAEAVILAVSAGVFLMTEDIKGRMGISDKWTGLMLLIAASALTADFIFLRYRGIRPDKRNHTAKPENDNNVT